MTIMPRVSVILVASACAALADFEGDMRAAAALCKAEKHEEARQAYLALGEAAQEPELRFQAIRDAAVCARLHKGGEALALQLAGRIKVEPYAKACRATVYQWQTSPSNVLAEFEREDFTTWPEDLAAVGFAVRAQAYYQMKNGEAAARDYLRAFQFSKGSAKWSALTRLGDVYLHLLDDERMAEACYRKSMNDSGGSAPGLQARSNLGNLLLAQKRHDAALECLKGDKHGGSWQSGLLLIEARVYADMGRTNEAIANLEAALKTVGIQPQQKKDCEKLLSELRRP